MQELAVVAVKIAGDANRFKTGLIPKKARKASDHGLFGQTAKSKDFVGIEFVDKSVLGDPKTVKLRFTDRYMRMAAEGKL